MGGVAAQMRVLLIPRRTIASMVIVVNSHLLAPDLVTATVEMIRLRPRRSFPADAVPVEESQYPTFLAERMCRLNLYQSGEAPVCFSSDQTFY